MLSTVDWLLRGIGEKLSSDGLAESSQLQAPEIVVIRSLPRRQTKSKAEEFILDMTTAYCQY